MTWPHRSPVPRRQRDRHTDVQDGCASVCSHQRCVRASYSRHYLLICFIDVAHFDIKVFKGLIWGCSFLCRVKDKDLVSFSFVLRTFMSPFTRRTGLWFFFVSCGFTRFEYQVCWLHEVSMVVDQQFEKCWFEFFLKDLENISKLSGLGSLCWEMLCLCFSPVTWSASFWSFSAFPFLWVTCPYLGFFFP